MALDDLAHTRITADATEFVAEIGKVAAASAGASTAIGQISTASQRVVTATASAADATGRVRKSYEELTAASDLYRTASASVAQANTTVAAATTRAGLSFDELRKSGRAKAEVLEKVRSALALSGVAANEATGAAAAWLQTGLKISAAGGGIALAITAISIAVAKAVEHFKEADQAARQFAASAALFGTSKSDIDSVSAAAKRLGVELEQAQVIGIAGLGRQAKLSSAEVASFLALAKTQADNTRGSVADAFREIVGGLGKNMEDASDRVQSMQARIRSLGAEIREVNNALASAQTRGFGAGITGPLEKQLATLRAEQERLREAQRAVGTIEDRGAGRALDDAREQQRQQSLQKQQQAEQQFASEVVAIRRAMNQQLAELDETGAESLFQREDRMIAEVRRAAELKQISAQEAEERIAQIREEFSQRYFALVDTETQKVTSAEAERARAKAEAAEEASALLGDMAADDFERIERAKLKQLESIQRAEADAAIGSLNVTARAAAARARVETNAQKQIEAAAREKYATEIQLIGASLAVTQQVVGIMISGEDAKKKAALKALAEQYAMKAVFLAIEGAAMMFIPGMQGMGGGLLVQAGLMAAQAGVALAASAAAPKPPSEEEQRRKEIREQITDEQRDKRIRADVERELGVADTRSEREKYREERLEQERQRQMREGVDQELEDLGLLESDDDDRRRGAGRQAGDTLNFNFQGRAFFTETELGKEIDRALQAYKFVRGY